jgi:4-hydroxy-tetrahydrodipicolinate synthase
VIAGTGSNNTIEAVELTRYAEKIGAAAHLSVCPYYNKPTQEGVIQHFEYLANECELPLILYNIPGRTAINMTPETICHLSRHANIIGIKEASGSLEQVSKIIRGCAKEFTVLSGDDSLTLPILAVGGRGVVSTTSNVAPKLMAELCTKFLEGRLEEARKIHYQLFPLFLALFCESNPVPAKTALSFMGAITNEVRMPLTVLTPEHTELVRKTIKDLGLI